MAHILVRNNKVVKTINGVRPLTTEEKANGGTRYPVASGVIIYIDGTTTVTSGEVTAISNPGAQTLVQTRRNQVIEWLRRMEKVPVANWGLMKNKDAKNYWWWLEMVGAASFVDSNLSDNAKWSLITDEMEWLPYRWYNEHNSSNWGNVRDVTRFWSTQSDGTYLARSSITMPSNTSNPNQANYWGGLTEYIYD